MKQRDIYLVNLNPIKGSEQAGVRPVVIVSGNTMNEKLEICIVCPISSKEKKYASCVPIKKSKSNGLSSNSEIISFQVRTVSKERFGKKLGKITEEQLEQVFSGLSDVLRY
ncbi:type II toxin-antitoxin system PemK/MazF family toxin [Candidatus Gracilibacteria bacterium]|nr:type II toxin-antitoxin system PemK/MazF family toxin [Candidatus Gracilibacteria bacterium]